MQQRRGRELWAKQAPGDALTRLERIGILEMQLVPEVGIEPTRPLRGSGF